MKNILFYLSLMISTFVSFSTLAEQDSEYFTDAELAQMLAPIALYPDSLLTHILIASTYPIEVIEAQRWVNKNDELNTKQKRKAIEDFDWDASVKALIPFKRILSRLSEDLSWTQALGDAFLQDESRLLLSIQTLRKQAKLAGSLKKMDNMDVRYEDNNIVILPKEKEVVYVPYYDSRMVYGSWFWAGYPPVYWHSPRHVRVSHYRPFYWNTGVHITFNYFFSAFHWHNRHVVVVAPHRSHYRKYSQRPRRLISHGGYAKRWSHKPSHRRGVAYRTKRTSEKYYSKRVNSHRSYKKSAERHSQVKQRLHYDNYALNKVRRHEKQAENKRVRYDKMQSGAFVKKHGLNHKPQSAKTHTNKQKPIVKNQQLRKERVNKSHSAPMRKEYKQSHRVNKPSHQKRASTQRQHSATSKERK